MRAIEINAQKLNPYIALCNTYIGQSNYKKAYEVVGQIEEVDSKYHKGENQEVVVELTKSIDMHKAEVEEADSIAITDGEIHQLFLAHYASAESTVTVIKGESEGNIYHCDVRCGVPGNPYAPKDYTV